MSPIFAPRRASALAAPALLLLITLAAMLLGATQATPGYTIRAGDAGDRRYLVRFFEVEENTDGTYRWSQPLFGVYLYGFDGRPAIVTLRMASSRPTGVAAPILSVASVGHDLGQITVGSGFRRYHILSPTSAVGETALSFRTDAYVPAGDPRDLGVALTNAAAAPLAGRPLLPPPVRSLFLLSLPLIVWLLLLRLHSRPALAFGAGLTMALVMGWATARPTDSGFLLPTLGWPWWPTLPLAALIFSSQIGVGLRWAWGWAIARPVVGWAGLALALASLFAIRAGLPASLGLTGLLVGAWAALTLESPLPSPPAPLPLRQERGEDASAPIVPWWPIMVILGMALFLRLYNLGGQPAGLWRDESRHGLQALMIWNDPTYRPVYVAAGADLPALLFYLMAPVVGLLGPQVWSDRLVSAVVGGLTPLALFWAASPLIGRRPALIAAALLAWASWGLSMSRWAFPATLDHLLTLTAVGLAWRGLQMADGRWQIGRLPSAICHLQLGLAGLLAGLATYAYHTGRVSPIALALVVLVRLRLSPSAWRRALPGLVIAATVGLLTMAPLLSYIAQNYGNYNRRVSQVSVLSSNYLDTHTPLGLLLDNGTRYLLMWHVQGEPNGRHHMPDAPMLDPATGLLLLLGLALALRAPRSPGRMAILAIPAVYLVPAIFSSDAPHAMRALGMLAPACMLAALAVESLLLRPGGRARQIIAVGLLVFSLGFNTWLYFGVMRVEPRVYGEFDLLETALGRAAQAPALSADPEIHALRVYMPDRLRGTDTVRFLAYGVATYGYTGDPLPADGSALLLLPADASPAAQATALAALGPGAAALDHVPYKPGTRDPIIIAFGRGEAAARLATELWP
ncbi:hypothetical protein EKD04_001385 [Chloroflexales bacterium ZM16-3]|nr:hypothetical protein [Chloroflexales bacterium ZM16-3]